MDDYVFNNKVRKTKKPKKNIWKRPLDDTEASIARKMYKTLVLNGILPNKALEWLATSFTIEKENMQACVITNDQLTYLATFKRINTPDKGDEEDVEVIYEKPATDDRGW